MFTSKFNDNLKNFKILWHSLALASPLCHLHHWPSPLSSFLSLLLAQHFRGITTPLIFMYCVFFFKSQFLVLSCSHRTEGYPRHQRWCMFFLSTTWRWDTGEDRVCSEELTDLGPGWSGKGQHSLLRGKEKWLGGANGLAQERVKRPGGASEHIVHEWQCADII